MTQTDFELVEAWQQGDADAGDRLVRRHFRSVFRFFVGKLPDADIEDLTQRTFMACAARRTSVDASRSFRAYLFGIARNELLMVRRTDRRREARHDAFAHQPQSHRTSPSAKVVVGEEERLMVRALRRLPVDHQIALEMHYFEELSYPEIAQILEVPVGTAKSRMSRAKDALRDQIAELSASPELVRSTVGDLDGWARSLRARMLDS